MPNEILCLPKKNNPNGEEILMLAVLKNAIECSRKIFLPTSESEKDYTRKLKSGFWRKITTGVSPLSLSVRPQIYTLITSARAYFHGRKPNPKSVLFRLIVDVVRG